MGLFDFLKKKTTSENVVEAVASTTATPVQMTNTVNTGVGVIDMSKSKESLNKVLIDMSKSSKIDMTKHTARVALAMDYSGSMDWLYDDGSVQAVVTRLLPIALKFDDNGELESWLFSNSKERLKPVTTENYDDYVKRVMRKAHMRMGGTNYAPVLKDMVYYYKDKHPSTIPAFIMFITDGDNFDKYETNEIIRELSNYNIFVQFVGIGDDDFSYLKKLDDLSGRAHDNTGFITVQDMNKMDDTTLYTALLRQYKDWLNSKN